jgi:hypothetical protein
MYITSLFKSLQGFYTPYRTALPIISRATPLMLEVRDIIGCTVRYRSLKRNFFLIIIIFYCIIFKLYLFYFLKKFIESNKKLYISLFKILNDRIKLTRNIRKCTVLRRRNGENILYQIFV